MRIVLFTTSGPVSVVAGTSTTIATVEPPTADEEWEIIYAQVTDTANIDVNDGIEYAWRDNIASLYQVLQIGNMKAGLLAITSNLSVFPNRETSFTPDSINFYDARAMPRLRKRDDKTSELQLKINVKTTGTVGTRMFGSSGVVLRRRLN
jgi:hypothetical protein